MTRLTVVVLVGLALTWLAGCGGGEGGTGPVVPPSDDGGSPTQVQVGPLLVRPAAAANFVAQEIPNPNGPISFVALHGSRVTYLASQAMLDRIVFSRGTVIDQDIWVCNLDGSNAVRLLDNAHLDYRPAWSPDGTRIAFDRTPLGQDAEIIVMSANGSGPTALTVNSVIDRGATWSPNGDQIAFETHRTGNPEVFAMYADGSGPVNLTNMAGDDWMPNWSRGLTEQFIVFSTTRAGPLEIYRMGATGTNPVRLTQHNGESVNPSISASGQTVAFAQNSGASFDIWTAPAGGLGPPTPFVSGPSGDGMPAWSSNDRFICYSSNADGDYELMLRETREPSRTYRLTTNAVEDLYPNLGSPTLQTDRVIIGPNGSDWGGTNPIWSSSDAGIAAWAADGYRNFVRIGVPANQLNTLSVTPLAATAQFNGIGSHGAPLGVVVEAADIVNLREDGGRGAPTLLWQLDPLDATAVLLYFDGYTGKLLSVLVLRDQNYPAGAGAAGPAAVQRLEGSATVVEDAFAAVFDATGARVADAAEEVRIAAGEVSVLR